MFKRKILKSILIGIGLAIAILIIAFLIYFKIAVTITPPVPDNLAALSLKRIKADNNFYTCKNSWLRKNKSELWEMYVEGKPFEIGVINGLLAKDLIYEQEKAFTNEIKKIIPSGFYRGLLKYFVAWFNRDIDKYIAKEYKLEIFGVSKSASAKFSNVGPAYQRILNYHAAHDIGHAMQNMHMVGCTSFAAWGSYTDDSSMIVGRNFDFYAGDDFAKNKIVCFYNPDKGYKFMFVSWGGMIGVVSGMNEKGLTVTLNSANSEIPYTAATPISIVAREILQYAKNIKEAYLIAKKHKTFVSESILIGSAEDKKTAVIEKSTNKIDLFYSKKEYLICTNHFQGDAFKTDKLNTENIKYSSSEYRYKRVDELINKYKKINYETAAEILRNQNGINNKNIGLGNEKAINQLIAHHSIIFDPMKLIVWVSSNPYQLGEYVAYDFKKVFNEFHGMKKNTEICEQELSIPADTFLFSNDYKNFLVYKQLLNEIKTNNKNIDEKSINKFIN
ncbi:MAG: C45 family autoproteolytic acyltransferase/hydrolase [Bacteroidales bacterium]|nr:C45 family autoproteolytic acyltransferase/hydrolase [Bacteroidales bacterium]